MLTPFPFRAALCPAPNTNSFSQHNTLFAHSTLTLSVHPTGPMIATVGPVSFPLRLGQSSLGRKLSFKTDPLVQSTGNETSN